MLKIPLEDFAEDIISKAQNGLKIDTEALADLSDLNRNDIAEARKGKATEEIIRKIAPHLNLDTESLLASFHKSWYPEDVNVDGLYQINTPFYDMTVNAYLYQIPNTKQAILFDTGVDDTELEEILSNNQLSLIGIFITHTHKDHIAALEIIQNKHPEAIIYSPKNEYLKGTIPVDENFSLDLDSIHISACETSGHSVGGITYILESTPKLVFAGDSIFAGSMGGGIISYADAITNNLTNILSLPNDSIICPGHGPITSVKQEKEHNPFFRNHFIG